MLSSATPLCHSSQTVVRSSALIVHGPRVSEKGQRIWAGKGRAPLAQPWGSGVDRVSSMPVHTLQGDRYKVICQSVNKTNILIGFLECTLMELHLALLLGIAGRLDMVYITPREGILATPKHFAHGKFSVGKPAVSRRTVEITPTEGLGQWGRTWRLNIIAYQSRLRGQF